MIYFGAKCDPPRLHAGNQFRKGRQLFLGGAMGETLLALLMESDDVINIAKATLNSISCLNTMKT